MKIDRSSSTPLYKQLLYILNDKILIGEFSPGFLLPTEQEFSEEYGVSRITVRKALEILERKELIEKIQGKGSIVKEERIKQNHNEVIGFSKSSEMHGFLTKSKLLDKDLIVGSSGLVALFDLSPEKKYYFWKFRRLRFIDEEPTAIMIHYVQKILGDKILNYNLENVSFFSLYENIMKRDLDKMEALISATTASPENAKLLKVKVGTPLIWYRAITSVAESFVVEVNYSLFLGEKIFLESRMVKPTAVKKDLIKLEMQELSI